jgi:iron(III) transport system substrate-binding protein
MAIIARCFRIALFASIVSALPGFSADGMSQTRVGTTVEQVEKLAAKEGKVHMANSFSAADAKQVLKGFSQKYPMIKVEHTQVSGTRRAERVLNEALAGLVEFDIYDVPGGMVKTFVEKGVLERVEWQKLFPNIRKVHVSPDGFFNALGFNLRVIGYNPSLVPKERIPKDWSDCLDPYWKGKMAVDTTPRSFVGLYNAWGESKILEYAARLKNNQPIWVSNQTQAVTQLATGEFSMLCGAHSNSMLRVLRRDPKANVALAIPRDVPVAMTENMALMKGAKNPNGAVLLIGWLTSSKEGQEAMEGLGRGSPYTDGTTTSKLIKAAGAKPVFQGWERAEQEPILTSKILAAWDLPVSK